MTARMAEDATMIWDHISATTTFVMSREGHIWSATVLQRMLISYLVLAQDKGKFLI
jgi:hypothetical protein